MNFRTSQNITKSTTKMKLILLTILVPACFTLVTSAPVPEEKTDRFRPYQYKYIVKDEERQLFFTKNESGDVDGKVSGVFSVLLADGRLLTVNYVADKQEGFVPKITFENPADPFSSEIGDPRK